MKRLLRFHHLHLHLHGGDKCIHMTQCANDGEGDCLLSDLGEQKAIVKRQNSPGEQTFLCCRKVRETKRQQWHSRDWLQAQLHKRPGERILQHAVWWVCLCDFFALALWTHPYVSISTTFLSHSAHIESVHYLFELYKSTNDAWRRQW